MEEETEIKEEETGEESCCLIGIDDDLSSIEAFDFYAGHIYKPGGRAILVHVIKPAVRSSNQLSYHLNAIRGLRQMEEKARIAYIQDLYEEKLRNAGIPGQINVIYYANQPGTVLCQMAEENNCAMIVLGSSRQGQPETGAQSDNLSSEVERVLKKAHCPVIIVRQDSTQGSRTEGQSEVITWAEDKELLARQGRKASCPAVPRRGTRVGALSSDLAGLDIEPPQQTIEAKWTPRRHSIVDQIFGRKFSK